jgi:hypothetical protein
VGDDFDVVIAKVIGRWSGSARRRPASAARAPDAAAPGYMPQRQRQWRCS